MIEGLQDVYVNVADMQRALAFYQGTLGLRVVESSEHWSALDVGGVRLGLHWTGGPPVPEVPYDDHGPHTGAVITLRVTDVEEVAAKLRDAGVRVLGAVSHAPWGSLVSFADPDGNVLKLMQPPR